MEYEIQQLKNLKKTETINLKKLGAPPWARNSLTAYIDSRSEINHQAADALFEKNSEKDFYNFKLEHAVPPWNDKFLDFAKISNETIAMVWGTNTIWNSNFLVLNVTSNTLEFFFPEEGICNLKSDEIIKFSKKYSTLTFRSCIWHPWNDEEIIDMNKRMATLGKFAGICQWHNGNYNEILLNDLPDQNDGLFPDYLLVINFL